MQLPFRMVRRTWMSGCWHTVGSNSHNYSFAGYCYLPKKLALCVLTCNTCFKDSVCHIALFVMHSADANFMHWFCGLHAFLPYYKKKKKKESCLNSHFTALLYFCSASVWSVWMDHQTVLEIPGWRLRYIEETQKQCLFYILKYN